jgi:hypothetical protein
LEFPRSNRGLAKIWTAVLLVLGSAIAALAVHEGKASTLPGLLLVSIVLFGMQRLEARELHAIGKGRVGLLVFLVLLTAVTSLIYFPTLHVYFFSDDFGCLHAFHQPSLERFFAMFHTDLAQLVEGETGQEIRPFYDLFYLGNYKLWALNPVGYHVTTILADILNSLLVFAIANKVAPGNQIRAGFAALLFSVQPLHSMAVSWIAGAPAEVFPTLFYLSSFFCFLCYRTTRKQRYLWLSLVAFAACLLCKEIAVTLPVLLVSWDLFKRLETNLKTPPDDAPNPQSERSRSIDLLPHLPFLLWLLGYLLWRHIAFGHFLGESFWADAWNEKSHGVISGSTGATQEFARCLRFLASEQVFSLHALLFLLPAASLAVVLGICLVWAIQILQSNPQGLRAIPVILYFGIVWFLVTGLPLLAAAPDPRHLYLPAVGPCLAIAFLAMPTSLILRKRAGYSRLLGCACIVVLFGLALRKQNDTWIQTGDTSQRVTRQLASAVAAMPEKSLVIVQLPGGAFLPFALQPPFTPTDLYARVDIIEPPQNSNLPALQWWQKNRQILEHELSGPPGDPIEINLFSWDNASASLRQSSRRLPREVLQSTLTQTLGSNPVSLESLTDDQADELVVDIAKLVDSSDAATRNE